MMERVGRQRDVFLSVVLIYYSSVCNYCDLNLLEKHEEKQL